MRRRSIRALPLLAVLVTGCAVPVGGPIPECEPALDTVGLALPEAGVQTPETMALECYRVVRDSRIEVVFAMPSGPDCYGVSVVDAVENADAVSVELQVGRLANPLGGACPEEETLWAVPVELNRSIEGREVLDRSRPAG